MISGASSSRCSAARRRGRSRLGGSRAVKTFVSAWSKRLQRSSTAPISLPFAGDYRSLAIQKDATSYSNMDPPTETPRGFRALNSELIGLKVDLIVARGTPAALAVKQATRTIPVIMAVGEPLLIVDSLARPGGNITGLSGVQPELETKRLELLTEIAPGSTGVAPC